MKTMNSMTEGHTFKILLKFAIPVILGNLLQQTYNLVDAVVVGNYIGADAFGAISASNRLMNLLIAVMMGFSLGATVVISQLFGAKRKDELKKASATTQISMFAISLFFSVLGVIFSRELLVMLNVDPLILDMANDYVKIIFCGVVPLSFYNLFTGLLRGVGNSRAPLVFLVIATVVNIFLDILFVKAFSLGIKGVAYATVIANVISALMSVIYIAVRTPELFVKFKEWAFDKWLFGKIIKAATPAVIQQIAIMFSLLVLQGFINGYGKDFTTGYGVADRIDGLITQPIMAIGQSLSSFAAQNKGAGREDRIVSGTWSAMIMLAVVCVFLGIPTLAFRKEVIMLFFMNESVDNIATVLQVAQEFMIIVIPFYFFLGGQYCINCMLQGAGDLNYSLFVKLVSMGIRTITAFIFEPIFHNYILLFWLFPISWFVGTVLAGGRFLRGKWKTVNLISKEELLNRE